MQSLRSLWILLIVLFLATRFFGVAFFAPHTDEMVYTQYAQRIAEDWSGNSTISVDGRMHGDYKEPLQYWLTSLTVGWFSDPLLGTRMWSVLMGFLGFVCTMLLAKRMFGKKVAIVTGVLLLSSPYFLYFDVVALAEVYLYGMGAAFLCFLYDAQSRDALRSYILATLFLGLMLCTKQSGALWIVPGVLLTAVTPSPDRRGLGRGALFLGKSRVLRKYVFFCAVVIDAFILRFLIVPWGFSNVATASRVGRVRSFSELPAFLADGGAWDAVVQGIRTTLWTEFGLLLPIVAMMGVGICAVLRKEESKTLRSLLVLLTGSALMFLAAALLLRFPYVRFYGLSLGVLSIAVSAVVVALWSRSIYKYRVGYAVVGVLFLLWRIYSFFVPVMIWGQTDMAFAESPGSWPQGIGVEQMLDHLEQFPPGVLVYDPQWGHPGTAVEVYAHRYPQLELVPGAAPVLEKLDEIRAVTAQKKKSLYLLFDQRLFGDRPPIDAVLQSSYCEKREVIEKIYRGRALHDTAIVLCISG